MSKNINEPTTLTGEIVIYQPASEENVQIEVKVKDGSVWLNRRQLALLFDRDVKTIGKHISNALKEELDSFPVVAKFAITAAAGKNYQVEYYNLDMIISIGYRVKSKRGVKFRIWANKVLRDYLLNGYAAKQRIMKIEDDIHSLKTKVNDIDFRINTNLPPHEGIFYDGQLFDAWQFASNSIKYRNPFTF